LIFAGLSNFSVNLLPAKQPKQIYLSIFSGMPSTASNLDFYPIVNFTIAYFIINYTAKINLPQDFFLVWQDFQLHIKKY
jgi:hypothetical protein